MNLLSEIISKPVLNLYTGKIEGTIKGANFDNSYKKVQYLKMFDNDEEEYLIIASKIYNIGENLVVIKNSEALTLATQNEPIENSPINLNAFSVTGKLIGKITDVELDKNWEVKQLLTNNNTKLKREQIINFGENIVVNDTNKKIHIFNFKPKMKIPQTVNNNNIITILPKIEENINTTETKDINNKENKKENYKIYNQPTPQRLIGNGNFLIGRKAIKTIYGMNNEIIIKKDNIINPKNLESAKQHSKLVELTIFSKVK